MRQPKRRSPLKILILIVVVAFLMYVNITIEPLTPTLFLPSPTPTISPETYVAEAEELAAQGKYSQALQAYDQAILSAPQDPSNYIASARLNMYAGDYDKAIENASNAVLLDQNNSMGRPKDSRLGCRVITLMRNLLSIAPSNLTRAIPARTHICRSCCQTRS